MSKLLLFVLALALTATLSGADDSDGSVFKCLSGLRGQRFRRSTVASVTDAAAFAAGAFSTTTPCDVVETFVACIKQSPNSKLTVFSDVFEKTISDRCGDNVDAKFWSGFVELGLSWQGESKRDGCEGGVVKGVDEACKKLSGCFFGTAFDAVKKNYSPEVANFAIDVNKFGTGAVFEAFIPEKLPQSCEFIFKP
ncbi:hypothetical protein AAVH_17655 [Aphelenchoides avenae]|nr:hypothetical protein AAVH_17655 [Aphelenchus avenae]